MEAFGLPTGFGKNASKKDHSAQIARTKRQSTDQASDDASETLPKNQGKAPVEEDRKPVVAEPPAPSQDGPVANDDGESNDDDNDHNDRDNHDVNGDEPEFETDVPALPISHEVVLKDHTKTVSALSLDPSGARIVSGGYDYECKLWDFGGMNSEFKPFRAWEAREGHQVHELLWSNTGDSFLCITGSNQPQLYDRDGAQISEFNKGDIYIRDLRHCPGHIAEVTSAAWHPKDPTNFITASADSTIRIWDTGDKRKSRGVIVVKSKERGTKTRVTACAYSPDGKTIAAACFDGTIHLWSTSSNFARPNATIEKAHIPHTHTSHLCFSPDGKHLISRGGDDTVKVWDAKAFKKPPIAEAKGLVSLNEETNMAFSPDGRYILTGTAGDKQAGTSGKVVFLDRYDLSVYRTLTVSPANVVRVLWHPRINQILTGSSDGSIHVLYSPNLSTRGATLSLTRGPRQRAPDDVLDLDRPIITPHALPMFRDDQQGVAAGGRGGKRKREKERQDPKLTQKPMPPLSGPGRGGRVGASATAHVVQGLVKDSIRHEDPREALLKFAAEHAGEAPKFTAAWTATNPTPVFDERLLQQEEEEEQERIRREEERKRLKRERPVPLQRG